MLLFTCIIMSLFALVGIIVPAQAYEDTLTTMEKRGTIYWGSDAEGGAPYVFCDLKDPTKLVGFEVDIMNEIAKRLNLKHQMIQTDWSSIVPALKRQDFDFIISGLEITEDRKRVVNFTKPYYVYSQQLVVNKDNTEIKKITDLKNKRVGTLTASAALRILENVGGVNIRIYNDIVGGYKDLEQNRLDAVLIDLPIASFYAKPNDKLKYVGEPFGDGYYGIAVRKEDKQLLAKLNQVINAMIVSGKMEEICKKWDLWTEEQGKLLEYKEVNVIQEKENTFNQLNKYIPLLLKGAFTTIKISVIAMFFAVLLGMSLAIVRIYSPWPFRFLSGAYIEIFRGTPLLIQLYIIYYGLPNIGIKLDSFTAAILGLALNYAAYEAENYRAGIQSIPKGQMEAALALGMTKPMAIRKIIVPQALKVVIPPVSNDFIALFKDSSIVSVIAMVELTKVYGYLATTTYDYIGLGLVAASLYFMMSYPASLLAKRIEKQLNYQTQ